MYMLKNKCLKLDPTYQSRRSLTRPGQTFTGQPLTSLKTPCLMLNSLFFPRSRFLYLLLRSDKNGWLIRVKGKVGFKPSISFHMFISTAPCGDGALFTHR